MHVNRQLSVVDATTLSHLRFFEEFEDPDKTKMTEISEQYASLKFEVFTRVYKYVVLIHEDIDDKNPLSNLSELE